jgi:secretion/DNA translocation related CpaE-like protein
MTHKRPLVVVTDETLLDEILRLAAAVGCDTLRVPDLIAAREHWADAPLILLDEHAIDGDLPLRSGVLLVTKGPPSADAWRRAFNSGIEQVVSFPEGEPVLVGALADIAEGPSLPGGCVVGVVGGRGGAGASVLAAAIGVVACGEGGALLVDCDPLGGGVDVLLGDELSHGLRWPKLRVEGGRVSMATLRGALPEHRHHGGRLTFLSCARHGDAPSGNAVASVIEAGRRSGGVVVCDLPRQFDAGAMAAVERADLIALVVPADVRSCVSARWTADRLSGYSGRLRLVVRGPAPGGLTPENVSQAVEVPLLTSMGLERALDKELERGHFTPRPTGPLITAARITLAAARAGAGTTEAAA